MCSKLRSSTLEEERSASTTPTRWITPLDPISSPSPDKLIQRDECVGTEGRAREVFPGGGLIQRRWVRTREGRLPATRRALHASRALLRDTCFARSRRETTRSRGRKRVKRVEKRSSKGGRTKQDVRRKRRVRCRDAVRRRRIHAQQVRDRTRQSSWTRHAREIRKIGARNVRRMGADVKMGRMA